MEFSSTGFLITVYRAALHATTMQSPAQVFFNRRIRTKMPDLGDGSKDYTVAEADKKNKFRMKQYADKKRKAMPHDLRIGDTVLVKQEQKIKLSTPFSSTPHIVKSVSGWRITAMDSEGREIVRNATFFKKIPRSIQEDKKRKDDENFQNELWDQVTVPEIQQGQGQLVPRVENPRYGLRRNIRAPRYFIEEQ